MAKPRLFMLGWVPFLSAVLCLLALTKGENVTSPSNVHFEMEFFFHILTWSHDKTNDDILYEVEYLRYGSDWTAVPHCHYISHQNCDLTVETLPKSLGYVGRVRSVLGNQTSEWSRSTRYTFTEVNLPPPTVLLDVNGPSLHVELILPEITKNNITRNFKDVFQFHRQYKVHIRRTTDNHTFQHVENVESFSIDSLAKSNEYCLSVKPSIASRQNVGEASSEICIYLPDHGLTSTALLLLAACILSFLVLLICVNLFICLYVRGVVKTPKTLKSLIQRSWSWMDKPPSPVIEKNLCWDTVLQDHLMAEPRDSPMRSSADSGFGSQLFINNIIKPSPLSLENSGDENNVSESRENSDFKEFNALKERFDRSLQDNGEDSGISLSTGSPTLKRTSSHTDTPYRGNAQSSNDCGKEVVVNVTLGYLKQLVPDKKPNSFEDEELGNTWQPQIKEYLSQRAENLYKGQIDCNILQEPWIQVPETFQTPIPLAQAFSPFSRVLWNLGVSAPSLGDVELLDTRS
ncbi:interleukin-10 receptor subunit alpha isoform X2 [Hyla sarda]|uniref:interleukin-10 receptor subunit alpha isoform X2 n=1 Tax=Hyla sarda TaxID=327740 RepID=UPI0024C36798|nr:interleukin-10 receptor subunit alpha isoform X2 [Hyla sarda]